MGFLEQVTAAVGDRYRVERELGHGGMAVVFLAHDLKHQRRVAIKLLKPEISAALGSERFLREIAIAATLQHPHILPLYDSGEAGGLVYYVMPFVEGESLRQRLARESQLPLDTALQITREVGSALQYAHEHGVVHRDIKPENIMLTGGHAVVLDFGIARALHAAGAAQLTQSGMVVGTPQYMSPEQSGGAVMDGRYRSVQPRVHALRNAERAATLHRLLVGRGARAPRARAGAEPADRAPDGSTRRRVRRSRAPWRRSRPIASPRCSGFSTRWDHRLDRGRGLAVARAGPGRRAARIAAGARGRGAARWWPPGGR